MDRILSVSGTENRFIARQIKEFEGYWSEAGWSELETQIVLDRILDQLPQAILQIHERIIGRVLQKISLYLAEQADG